MIIRSALLGLYLGIVVILLLLLAPQKASEPDLQDLPPKLYPIAEREELSQPNVPAKDLVRISKRPDVREVTPGSTVAIQIELENIGNETLTGLNIEERFDMAHLTILDAQDGVIGENKITWEITELPLGHVWFTRVLAKIRDNGPSGAIETTTYVLGEAVEGMSSTKRLATSTLTPITLPPAGVKLPWFLRLY